MIRIARVTLKTPLGVNLRRQYICENGTWVNAVFQFHFHDLSWHRIR